MNSLENIFSLKDKVAFITGGGGLLGEKHAEAIAEAGGTPLIIDINIAKAQDIASRLNKEFECKAKAYVIDITDKESIEQGVLEIIAEYEKIDILINNAANNPKVSKDVSMANFSRLENFPLTQWEDDIKVGLTGAFLCAQVIGAQMAKNQDGVIINIASDLGVVAPDQRLYKKEGIAEDKQNVKPVTYSVVKHGLIGLTKYLSTYWPEKGVRCVSLSPGGVLNDQNDAFLNEVNSRIPLGRMAHKDEYKGAIIFLCSKASSYMNGSNLIIDGGRTAW
jgi:NAD(P)-dependent dehydrogenase (short-subunit alcohol dehydrogenase family)